LSIPQLLTASHIVPWSVDAKNRTNPQNGLCLNAIHDRAFDSGLLTVTPELKIRVSTKTKRSMADKAAREFLWDYEGAPISPPRRFAPNTEFLRYHNEIIFLGT
jgi:predicted restriction endonuclease